MLSVLIAVSSPSCFMFAAIFPFLEPVMKYLKMDIMDQNVVKFFMDVTEAACSLRKEEGNSAGKVSPGREWGGGYNERMAGQHLGRGLCTGKVWD